MTLERMFQLKNGFKKLILNQLMAWLLRMEQITLEETAYFLDITLEKKSPLF